MGARTEVRPSFATLLAALTFLAPLVAFAPTASAANCRSNVECDPPVTTADIAGVAGENGWWRSDVTALLVCTDASGCSSTKYSLDQADWMLWDGSTIPVADDGLHSLEAASEDQHGNKEIYPTLNMIRIDTIAPDVAITSPTEGNAYGRNVQDPVDEGLPATPVVDDKTIEVDLADGLSGPQRVEFFVDDGLRAVDGAAPFTWVWATGDESLGEHKITVVGYDVAGNSAGDEIVVFTVPLSQAGAEATAADAQGMLPGGA